MNILFLFAQVATEEAADAATEIAADAAQTQAQINIIDLAMKGGWIMGVLLVLSLVAIYFFIQRLLVIRQAGRNDETFMNRIRDYIYEGKIDQALNLCRTTPTPAASRASSCMCAPPFLRESLNIRKECNLSVTLLNKRMAPRTGLEPVTF